MCNGRQRYDLTEYAQSQEASQRKTYQNTTMLADILARSFVALLAGIVPLVILNFQNGPKVYILTVSICTIVFLFLFHWDRKPQTKRLWWLPRVMLLFLSYLFPALRIHSLHRLCRVIKSREGEVEVSSIETADAQRFPVFLSVASVLVFSPLISAITTLHLDNQSRYQGIARPARRAHPRVSIANRCRTIEIELRSSRVRSRVFEFELMW